MKRIYLGLQTRWIQLESIKNQIIPEMNILKVTIQDITSSYEFTLSYQSTFSFYMVITTTLRLFYNAYYIETDKYCIRTNQGNIRLFTKQDIPSLYLQTPIVFDYRCFVIDQTELEELANAIEEEYFNIR